ncbi:MAG: hypothetical protein IPQ08_03965 [Chitinophagaceae bacterium]|nr:hypothetical protein [Chitinophagaceae bacterium]
MKAISFLLALCFSLTCFAQESLIVYGLKGRASSIINKQEKALKIGNVLPQSTVVKLEEGSSITLLCKQGIQFVLGKAGSYSLQRYKDSCKTRTNSVSSNYLSYLWGQLYSNSSDHRSERHESNLAVSRGTGKEGKGKKDPRKRVIEFSKGMDLLKIAEKDFNLCWNCFDMEGAYIFRLYDEKGARTLKKDSIEDNYISTALLRTEMVPGRIYKWNIYAPDAGFIKKRNIVLVKQEEIQTLLNRLYAESIAGEDSASFYFRVAYTMEQNHYLGEAWHYYQLAFHTDEHNNLVKERYTRFRNEYYLGE